MEGNLPVGPVHWYCTGIHADVRFLYPESVLQHNAKELSKLVYVSPPTMIRFVKKLGFQGYHDFQMTYSQEHMMFNETRDRRIDQNSSIPEIINILPDIYYHVFMETKKLTKTESFVRTVNYMMEHNILLNEGDSMTLTVSQLFDEDLIERPTDPNDTGNLCDGTITVTNVSTSSTVGLDKYQYVVDLDCGNRDQSKMNVARRTCGYIGSNFWNQGRTEEIKDRYVHLGTTEDMQLC